MKGEKVSYLINEE